MKHTLTKKEEKTLMKLVVHPTNNKVGKINIKSRFERLVYGQSNRRGHCPVASRAFHAPNVGFIPDTEHPAPPPIHRNPSMSHTVSAFEFSWGDRQVLGVHMVGDAAGEIIQFAGICLKVRTPQCLNAFRVWGLGFGGWGLGFRVRYLLQHEDPQFF
jgi:hypothetical protein